MRKIKRRMKVWFYFHQNPLAGNKMRTSFSSPNTVIYQEGNVLWGIQSIFTSSYPFLAHEVKLFDCRTPLTANQTHIVITQLEDVDFSIAKE